VHLWACDTARTSLPPYCEISSRSRSWRLFPGARRVPFAGTPGGNGHERMGIWRYGQTTGHGSTGTGAVRTG